MKVSGLFPPLFQTGFFPFSAMHHNYGTNLMISNNHLPAVGPQTSSHLASHQQLTPLLSLTPLFSGNLTCKLLSVFYELQNCSSVSCPWLLMFKLLKDLCLSLFTFHFLFLLWAHVHVISVTTEIVPAPIVSPSISVESRVCSCLLDFHSNISEPLPTRHFQSQIRVILPVSHLVHSPILFLCSMVYKGHHCPSAVQSGSLRFFLTVILSPSPANVTFKVMEIPNVTSRTEPGVSTLIL